MCGIFFLAIASPFLFSTLSRTLDNQPTSLQNFPASLSLGLANDKHQLAFRSKTTEIGLFILLSSSLQCCEGRLLYITQIPSFSHLVLFFPRFVSDLSCPFTLAPWTVLSLLRFLIPLLNRAIIRLFPKYFVCTFHFSQTLNDIGNLFFLPLLFLFLLLTY